jgi:hypothetical protein
MYYIFTYFLRTAKRNVLFLPVAKHHQALKVYWTWDVEFSVFLALRRRNGKFYCAAALPSR